MSSMADVLERYDELVTKPHIIAPDMTQLLHDMATEIRALRMSMSAPHRPIHAYERRVLECKTNGHNRRRDGTCAHCFKRLTPNDWVSRERTVD